MKRPVKTFDNDRPVSDDGADDGVRTRDPDLGKVVLYQLSHVRIGEEIYYVNSPSRASPNFNFFENS